MERWQREYIASKLPRLLETTVCRPNLLSFLQSKNILGLVDVDILETIGNSDGKHAQAKLLYEVLCTRANAYSITVEALHESRQTGARNILLCGYVLQGIYPPFGFAEDVMDSSSEDFSLHDEVLSKSVTVQGRKIRLSDFCHGIDPIKLKEIMRKTLDKDDMLALMRNEYDLTTNTIPNVPDYYIPRTLTGRFRLKTDVLNDSEHDIFLVKDITLNQFSHLVSPSIVDRSSNQLSRTNVRHIICELDEDFDTISKKARPGSAVHLLQYEDSKIQWIRSHGYIGTILDNVHEIQDPMTDEALLQDLKKDTNRQRPVCISDTPGMGKTVLLAKIANDIKSRQGNTLVLFFVLREFMQHLPSKVKDITTEKVYGLIASQITTSRFAKEIILQYLESDDKRADIFLDGFDEVLDKQIEPTKQLLRVITSKFSNNRVHVATRPHMRRELEETLGTLGYNILPFQDTDQVNFLVNFWTSNMASAPPRNSQDIFNEFAKVCLKTLKENMTDDEKDIAGVPLQCRLLGEIYQSQAERRLIGLHTDNEILITSILEMYKNLMQIRFEKAKQQQKVRDRSKLGAGKFLSLLSGRKPWTKEAKNIHFIAAIDLLFPEFTETAKKVLVVDHQKYVGRKDIYDLGLIEATNTIDQSYRFLHRTYAEYLVAEFVVNVLTSTKRMYKEKKFWVSFLEFLFDKILRSVGVAERVIWVSVGNKESLLMTNEFHNSVITYFINALLGTKGEILKNNYRLPIIDSVLITESLVSCSYSNLRNLFDLIVNLFKDKHTIIPKAELLVTAAKYSDFEFNNKVHSLVNGSTELWFKDTAYSLATCVEVAAQLGKYQVIQVILNRYKDLCMSYTVLHICIIGSIFDNADTLKQKSEITKLILGHAPQLLDQKLKHDASTPILQPSVDRELIKCLLEKGANVNATTKSNENVLHVFLCRNEYYKIKETEMFEFLNLIMTYNFNGYNSPNSDGEIPLSLALRTADVGANSIDLFQRVTNLQFVNKKQENLIFTAIENKQSLECIEALKHYGVDIKQVNLNSESLLHIASATGHLKALKFLLTEIPNMVNAQGIHGNTPLHVAFTKNTSSHSSIRDILLKHGANMLATNAEGQTPIEFGLEHSTDLVVTVQTLNRFKDLGHLLSPDNIDGLLRSILMNQSGLMWDIRGEFGDMIRHLICIGGRVKCDNGDFPASINGIKRCLARISQILYHTYFAKYVLKEIENDIFEMTVNQILSERDKELFSNFRLKQVSLDVVILILLRLNDRPSFRMLQTAYQLVQSKSLRFRDTDVAEFINNVDENICVVVTQNVLLTIARIQEQIDPTILVIDVSAFQNISDTLEGDIVVIASGFLPPSIITSYPTRLDRIIVVLENICNMQTSAVAFHDSIAVFQDEYNWHSLSSVLQNEILLQFRSQNKREWCKGQNTIQTLDMFEILTSPVMKISFLIPNQVQAAFYEIIGVDAASKNANLSLSKLQRDARIYLFREYEPTENIFNGDNLISTRLRKVIHYGPTLSYLAAPGILSNFSLLTALNHDLFVTGLFSYYDTNVEIVNPMNGRKVTLTTYTFKYWLVLYFLNKLVSKDSAPTPIVIDSAVAEAILHCCINLRAPNLLYLFEYNFSLDNNMVRLATKLGCLHMFTEWYYFQAKHEDDFINPESVYQTSLYTALQQLSLDDIACFVNLHEYGFKNSDLCDDLISLCTVNTINQNSDTIQRKLLALKILCNDLGEPTFLSPLSIENSLNVTKNMHIEIIRFLILNGANPLLCTDTTPADLLQSLAINSTPSEVQEITKIISAFRDSLIAKDEAS